jgi:hypothetical protein
MCLVACNFLDQRYTYTQGRETETRQQRNTVCCVVSVTPAKERMLTGGGLYYGVIEAKTRHGTGVLLSSLYRIRWCDLCGRPNPTTSGANAAQISVGIYVCVYIWGVSLYVLEESLFLGGNLVVGFKIRSVKAHKAIGKNSYYERRDPGLWNNKLSNCCDVMSGF